jgi:hypothetical protein
MTRKPAKLLIRLVAGGALGYEGKSGLQAGQQLLAKPQKHGFALSDVHRYAPELDELSRCAENRMA